MGDRQYDITIFGATGYAGKVICMELLHQNLKNNLNIKIAFAARSNERLKELANELEPQFSDCKVGLVIADVFDTHSLITMCQQSKIIINCVGPYRFYGENVIKNCINEKTNYIDITGEPQFMEIIELKYSQLALDNNISIIMSCGFDSFPADIGTMYLINNINKNKIINKIKVCHDISTKTIHSTTWRTAILSVESVSELKRLRDNNKNDTKDNKDNKNKKDIKKRYHFPYCLYDNILHKYLIKFIGSDHSVIRRTFKKLDINIDLGVYQIQNSLLSFVLFILYSMFLYVLLLFSFTRELLIRYPSLFTFGYVKEEGASLADLKKGYTKTFFIGEYDNECTVAKFYGPEPGYILTSLTSIFSAITLLKDKHTKKGVLTPGYAFRDTNIINQISKEGISLQVVYQGNINNCPKYFN